MFFIIEKDQLINDQNEQNINHRTSKNIEFIE